MRSKDVIGALDQQTSKISVAGMGDAELRIVISRLTSPRSQAQVAIEPRRINYKRILRAIMHRDFWNRRPRIDDYVYFVNTSRNMILHMYDDRGLDIIAPQVDDLRPIYQTRKDWILDFDSAAIAQMFESNTPIPDFDYRRSPPPSVS
jgi:hypothetical protein